jgi:putative oligomerization/nucleic acid binding protein
VPKGLVDANLQASEVALELLVWDRTRVADPGSVSERTEGLIVRGANCYRRLLLTLHGERGDVDSPLAEGQEWLQESHDLRGDREDMTEKGSLFSKSKLKVTGPDLDRLDRAHPETSFSATPSPDETSGASGTGETGGAGGDQDVVDALERLGAMHASGLLSDEEFSAAKGRVLG